MFRHVLAGTVGLHALQPAKAQGLGQYELEIHPNITWSRCSGTGGSNCSTVSAELTLDSNYRWIHLKDGYQNCYDGNVWNTRVCANSTECTKSCVLEGADYKNVYGVNATKNSVALKFVTKIEYSQNVGSKIHLMQDADNYEMFKLVGNEFSFDVDVSNLPCGIMGGLYFVAMPQRGFGKAGARYGTGYCDAQCDRSQKFVNGTANTDNWLPSPNDPVSGVGSLGSCCAEFDLWNANSISTAMTAHSCQPEDYSVCYGSECDSTYAPSQHKGACDPEGCDFNPYRLGAKTFYGKGSNFTIDTSKPFTVVTQFVGSGSLLQGIKRYYVQNGKTIENPQPTISGISGNVMDQAFCDAENTAFGDLVYSFNQHGGLKAVGRAMAEGMVLVMKIADDYNGNMLWLDSQMPTDADPAKPGVTRGSCGVDSGDPVLTENGWPDSKVVFSNIKFGPIGSTHVQPVDGSMV